MAFSLLDTPRTGSSADPSRVAALPRGISVVVPVFNSQNMLPDLLQRVSAVVESIGRPFEIILVNDGSPDDSWRVISDLALRHPWLRGINLMRNYGQHNALLCAVRAARFDVIVTLDDDLQNPPEEIPRLLEKLDQGYDVVYGTSKHKQHSLGHRLGAEMLLVGLYVALGARTARIVSPLRAFRTRLRGAFAAYQSSWVILDVLLTWGTTRFASVPVRHDKRTLGKSNYTLLLKAEQAFNLITGFSTLPLRVASFVGFAFTLFGMGLLAYVLGIYFAYGAMVPGWAFLGCAIALFSGAQLFALGIAGEYLARMFVRNMDRPPYTVTETVAGHSDDPTTSAQRQAES